MVTLTSDLRNKLERVIIEARDAAEIGARAVLEALAVDHYEPYPHMTPEQRKLRNHLRARARQLGDRKWPRVDSSGKDHEINHLVGECAYEHWHRMLFARFLAENNLLIEPDTNMAISLAEAEELANEESVDVWVYASRCAQRMLPQIFRPDDPLLQINFATEHMLRLERLLASLPAAVFTASDALGWVYQFWQSKKKDEVNHSEVKIGADEIAAVTQLFTEPYMVEFLIHNTLGAWWAAKNLEVKDAANAKTEDELRAKLALPGVTWDYLRFVRASPSPSTGEGRGEGDCLWRPAAGTFEGWPTSAKEIKCLDPCCGSGHFLVSLLRHLAPIRMIEERLSERDAVDAVLCDNIHGLEIDERCCQIAAFALALAAWTYPDAGDYRPLSELHIACTGIGPQATEEQWIRLAEQSGMPTQSVECERVKNGLLNLYRLFSQAPTLGSLINPKQLKDDVFAAGYETFRPYLEAVLKAEKTDDETHEQAIAAAGMFKAAGLLAGDYALVVTNVPYLGRKKQSSVLQEFCERFYSNAKADLATCFVERCLEFCSCAGTAAMVTIQNWLFYDGFQKLRRRLLQYMQWNSVSRLGAKGFRTPMWDFNVMLIELSRRTPIDAQTFMGLDVSEEVTPDEKDKALRKKAVSIARQESQLLNPSARVDLETVTMETLLAKFVDLGKGSVTGDGPHYLRKFWEIDLITTEWLRWLNTPKSGEFFSGREHLMFWRNEGADVRSELGAWLRGDNVFGKEGILINKTTLMCAFYSGEMFDDNTGAIIPLDYSNFKAILAFLTDSEFPVSVKKVDQSLKVTIGSFGKIPFDVSYWKKVAADKYPDDVPEPESDDPTQWLFHGRPEQSTAPLQVAVARLLGYRWPAELDETMRLSKRAKALVKKCGELATVADNGGIVCIPAVRGKDPAAERLLKLLVACEIEPDVDLDDWLRNGFFEEHCKLFHDRPFVWHIWDGRKRDGFHALVNYHKLCEGDGKGRRLLENLTYAYLGEWITRQKDEVKRGEGGAEDRLAAALELQKRLEAILVGEPPFDIFVRWKPLHEQPIGWEPDINDGVRLNIRPFLASDLPGGRIGAGILRYKPNIKWTKDRGKEPQRPKDEYPWFWAWDEKTVVFMGGKSCDGNRWNDCHYTNQSKQAAREAAKKGGK